MGDAYGRTVEGAAKTLLALPQRTFGILLGRHVEGGQRGAPGPPRGAGALEVDLLAHVQPAHLAVRPRRAQIHFERAAGHGVERCGNRLQHRIAVIGMHARVQRLARQRDCHVAQAEQPRRFAREMGQPVVVVHFRQRQTGDLDAERQSGLAGAQGLLGPLALADVDQHVDAAGRRAIGSAQHGRIRREPYPCSVGSLRHQFLAAHRAVLLEADGHRALVVRHRRAVRVEQFPAHAPAVGAQLGCAAAQRHRGGVAIGQEAFGVGAVDGHRQGVDRLAQPPFAGAQRGLCCAAFGGQRKTRDRVVDRACQARAREPTRAEVVFGARAQQTRRGELVRPGQYHHRRGRPSAAATHVRQCFGRVHVLQVVIEQHAVERVAPGFA